MELLDHETISDQKETVSEVLTQRASFLIFFQFSSHNIMALILHFLYIIPANARVLSIHIEKWNMAGTYKSAKNVLVI